MIFGGKDGLGRKEMGYLDTEEDTESHDDLSWTEPRQGIAGEIRHTIGRIRDFQGSRRASDWPEEDREAQRDRSKGHAG